MTEKTSLGLVENILHSICIAFCIGVLASAAATLTTIDNTNIFEDAPDGSEVADDVDTYRGIAWWLLVMSIFGIVTQIMMLFIRVMYYTGRFESLFVVFGILALIFTALLTLGLLSGGVGSAENAADVQDDYLDGINCDGYDPSDDVTRELCRDLQEVRSSQVSAAVVALIGFVVSALLTMTILGSTLTRAKELA